MTSMTVSLLGECRDPHKGEPCASLATRRNYAGRDVFDNVGVVKGMCRCEPEAPRRPGNEWLKRWMDGS